MIPSRESFSQILSLTGALLLFITFQRGDVRKKLIITGELNFRRGKLSTKSVWDRVYETAEKYSNSNVSESRESDEKK